MPVFSHQSNRLSLVLASCAILLPALASAAPPPMKAMSYEQAVAQTQDIDRITILWFTADWCGPCGLMESEVWSDDEVGKKIAEYNLTIVPIDTDEHPEIASKHTVTSIPSSIAIMSGNEAARLVGVKDSAELIMWMTNIDEARRIHKEAVARHSDKARVDIKSRLDNARDLVKAGSYQQATDEYLWLWDNMIVHDASRAGVRLSFMASDMEKLAEKYLGAQKAFTRLRDRVEDELKIQKGDAKLFKDWLVLNVKVLHDERPIEQWLDGLRDDPDKADREFRSVWYLIDNYLIDHKEWKLLGYAQPGPDQMISRARIGIDHMPDLGLDKEMQAREEQRAQARYIDQMTIAHIAYLAAGRDGEAWKITEVLFETFNTPETHTQLLETVLDAELVRPEHIELAPKADRKIARKCRSFLARQKLDEN